MEKSIDNITGVVVSYDDSTLITESVMSIRQYYSTMKIIIVEGSPVNSPCIETSRKLALENPGIEAHIMKKNIGHGAGMHYGIEKAKTDFVLVFDSDIILQNPCLDDMVSNMDEGILCVGELVFIDKRGEGRYPDDTVVTAENGGCPYIHPYFEMINRHEYKKYKPFVHHGSPCIHTMFDVFTKGLSGKVLKNYPTKHFVHHPEGGTRLKYPPEFLRDWINYKDE